jgi:hypothetical protein
VIRAGGFALLQSSALFLSYARAVLLINRAGTASRIKGRSGTNALSTLPYMRQPIILMDHNLQKTRNLMLLLCASKD